MSRVIVSDERGALHIEPDMLGEARPNTRYVVEAGAEGLTVRPEVSASSTNGAGVAEGKLSPEEWERMRDELTELLTAVWPQGVSVVDVISEMRR